MATWRSYRRRSGPYRKYRKRSNGSYTKRSYGQFKAARQQADQASFVMSIPTQIAAKCLQRVVTLRDGTQELKELGTYALNIYDLLRKSEFYKSYANMYDEFKIDNIKVKLIPIKYNVTVGDANSTAGYQSFTVYTAWDRTGLNNKQMYIETNGSFNDSPIDQSKPDGAKNYQYIGKLGDWDGLYCTVGTDIATYSSAETRQVSVGQNSSIVRWLKPKTLSEKSQWLSTSTLKPWYYEYDTTYGIYRMIPISTGTNVPIPSKFTDLPNRTFTSVLSDISPAVAGNPCFLEEDPTVSFKPTLLVGLYPADPQGTELPRTVYFNVEAEVSCSFRGLRKSKVVSEDMISYPIETQIQNNRVTIQFNETGNASLDEAMNTSSERSIRAINNGNEFAVVSIPNLLSVGNKYLVENQKGLAYATDIEIKLPKNQLCTPLQTNGIQISQTGKIPSIAYYQRWEEGALNPIVTPQFNSSNLWGKPVTETLFIPFDGSINNNSESQYYDAESWWSGLSPENTRFFAAKKTLRDGTVSETAVAQIDLKLGQTLLMFKCSNDDPNSYNLCAIANNTETDTSFVIEMPLDVLTRNGNDVRGWKDWIKGIYNGCCYVNNICGKIDEVTNHVLGTLPVVGQVFSTVITVTGTVKTVGAPFISLLDTLTMAQRAELQERKELAKQQKRLRGEELRAEDNEYVGPRFQLYPLVPLRDGSYEPSWNDDPLTPGQDYEIPDDIMASIESKVFDPVIATNARQLLRQQMQQ